MEKENNIKRKTLVLDKDKSYYINYNTGTESKMNMFTDDVKVKKKTMKNQNSFTKGSNKAKWMEL